MRGIKALLNNKGSSVIMVLIAMAFISILGTILMFSAYTGYQIKAAEGRGERAFYSAETALDEVRAGIQGIVIDCIAKAYTDMLRGYSHDNAELLEDIFRGYFKTHLIDSELLEEGAEIGEYLYNLTLLQSFAGNSAVTSAFDGEIIQEANAFILRGIQIRHRSAAGFVSRIESDIIIAVPDFSYVRADYPINEIALIAANGLNVSATEASINGGIAYAGGVNVNSGGGLKVDDGILVSSGNTFLDGGALTINSNSTIWTGRIIVGDNDSFVQLLGEAYVADDLELNGLGAGAVLAGSYYGFGSSLLRADESSSIIVNGRESTLDMSGLKTLFLSGHSFVDTKAGNIDILMGQSISVKSDQLAYLVPASAVNGHMNPVIFTTGQTLPVHGVTPQTLLWNGRTIESYNAVVEAVIRPIPDANQTLMFLFLRFIDETHPTSGEIIKTAREFANDYFKAYFEENKEDIESYLESYLTLTGSPDNSQTSGLYYFETSVGEIEIRIEDEFNLTNLATVSSRLGQMYLNVTRTLSTSIHVQENDNLMPFGRIVRLDSNERISNGTAPLPFNHDNDGSCMTLFADSDGIVRSVIINCTAEHSVSSILGSHPHVNLILSRGSITVGSFNGLIISNGTVVLNGDITIPDNIIPSIRARHETYGMFGYYLNQPIADDEFSTLAWDMSKLVFYENWRKF